MGDTPASVTRPGDASAYRRRVHQAFGPVALVLVGLWLAYLVPYKLRHRQQMLESRADDRYSEALRIVRVAQRPPRAGHLVRPAERRGHAGTTGLLTPGRGLPAVVAASRTGGDTVDRPHATPERVTAEAARHAAQVRAARVAAGARRAAAARRRAALFAFLLVATVVVWVVVGLAPAVPPLVGLVPTVLLVSVLGAGRHAVVAGRRNDAALAEQIAAADELAENLRTGQVAVVPATGAVRRAASAPTPTVTGRAVRPSDAQTEVFEAIVADKGEKGSSVRHASSGATAAVRRDATPTQGVRAVAKGAKAGAAAKTGATPALPVAAGAPAAIAPAAAPAAVAQPGAAASATSAAKIEPDEAWKPVPVPPPTYTMKPAAPRRQPVPLGEVEASTAVRPADVDDELLTPEAPAAESSGSIDLNAILAKRRAAGE